MNTTVGLIAPSTLKRVGMFLLAVGLTVGTAGCSSDSNLTPTLQHSLTISSTEGGQVTIPGEATFRYDQGTVLDLVAEAYEGYRFVNWTGDVGTISDASASQTAVTVEGDYSITANFVAQYSLTIGRTSGGVIHAPGEGSFTYDVGAVVYLVAIPARGCLFVNWSGDVATIADIEAAVTNIVINGSYSIIASFEEEEVVYFADAKLEAAVREMINIWEGPLYASALERLTRLETADRGISSLAGLEHATSLTKLSLFSERISDISPLANLTSLTELWLHDNKISDISPLANLTNLTELVLSNNPISDISPLANLAGLTRLDLQSSQILDITPLSPLTDLRSLNLHCNQVSEISSLNSLTNLVELHLGINQISDISPLKSLTELTSLNLYGNQISDISALRSLARLTELHLSHNRISNIQPLVENTGLSEGDWVDLRGNPLSSTSISTYIPQLRARGVTVDH